MSGDEEQEDKAPFNFDDYSWGEDQEWQILVKKLEFPPSFTEYQKDKFILKRKQKYFKKNIDPSFEIKRKQQQQQQQTSNESNNAGSTSSTSAQPSFEEPTTNSNTNSNSTSSSSGSESNNSTSSNTNTSSTSSSANQQQQQPRSQQNPYGRYQPPPTRFGSMIAPVLNYFYLIAQWFIFVNAILSIVNPSSYTYALLGVGITHAIATIQNCGKPQFAQWYAQLIMREENTLIAVYGLVLLMGARHLIFLSPIILRSLYMACYLSNGFFSSKLPQSLYSTVAPLLTKITSKQAWFNNNVAMCEVMVGVFLIFACFVMARTVIMTLIYWQVMQARYMMNGFIRYAFTRVHLKISSVLSSIPFLLNLYNKLAGMLGGMVDPAQMQQRMQGGAGGGGGGMLGGIRGMASKFCTIM